MPSKETLTIENARIIFRNFEGRVGKYNKSGIRTFSVIIDRESVDELRSAGWNVKMREGREDGDEPIYHLPVTVSYRYTPPEVHLISPRSRTMSELTEDDVKTLDWVVIENADLIINPHHWDVNGKQGIKAYLKKLYITRVEDDLDVKYANLFDDDMDRFIKGAEFDDIDYNDIDEN